MAEVYTCNFTEPQVFLSPVTSQIDIDVFWAILEKTTWIPTIGSRFIFMERNKVGTGFGFGGFKT